MSELTYALTGVTGLLGRNVFFEIIKDNLRNLENIEIIIFGRPFIDETSTESLKDRIKNIFYTEGVNYLSFDENCKCLDWFLEKNIDYVNIEFSAVDIISEQDLEVIQKRPIDFFIHMAASTDFGSYPQVKESLNHQNVAGTASLLELCSTLDIRELGYVSSAYACGKSYGDILPSYTNFNQEFRNHYEWTKLEGERLVMEYQKRTGVRCRIFRPSTIVGKLMEGKKGEIYKFDVIYSWAKFFLKWKIKSQGNDGPDYKENLDINMRIALNPFAGLNIVPVDFAAKVLYLICKQNLIGDYFHLVNSEDTKNSIYTSEILKSLNITGYMLVDDMPEDLNALESLYYKTVGSIFSPYLMQPSIYFNTDNLQELFAQHNLSCPTIDQQNLEILLAYAKLKDFGLKPNIKVKLVK